MLPSDKVTLDGKPIDAPQPARLWLYYKPVGLVTSAKDEKGRQTVFDTMPADMPRVMSVGRLDLNSEGLLLLTNDGELKRKLELPSTGWLRKYRVRVNGRPNEATFDPLRRGVTIDGEDFQPMEITLDKQQGANAWLTVGLREGKNREIRRAMTEVGLIVNRLIRVSYGPFRLNKMKPGDVVEVKQKVLREQLGDPRGSDEDDNPARARKPRQGGAAKAEGRAASKATREARDRPEGDRKAPFGAKKSFGKRPEGDARPERGGKPHERKGSFAKRPARDDADANDPAGRSNASRGKPRSAAARADRQAALCRRKARHRRGPAPAPSGAFGRGWRGAEIRWRQTLRRQAGRQGWRPVTSPSGTFRGWRPGWQALWRQAGWRRASGEGSALRRQIRPRSARRRRRRSPPLRQTFAARQGWLCRQARKWRQGPPRPNRRGCGQTARTAQGAGPQGLNPAARREPAVTTPRPPRGTDQAKFPPRKGLASAGRRASLRAVIWGRVDDR